MLFIAEKTIQHHNDKGASRKDVPGQGGGGGQPKGDKVKQPL